MLWREIETQIGNILILPSDTPLPSDELERGASEATLQHVQNLKAPVRRSEYLRSRWLMRQRMGQASDCSLDLPSSPDGDLVWPAGVCGSLSHKRGHIALSIVSSNEWDSVGVDMEAQLVNPGILSKVMTSAEAELLRMHFAGDLFVAALFSAKEALFKAAFPLGRKMFWFNDAELKHIQQTQVGYKMLLDVNKDIGLSQERSKNIAIEVQMIELQVLETSTKVLNTERYWLSVTGFKCEVH